MAKNIKILQELNELESSLAKMEPTQQFQVPEGYFENFAHSVMDRIRAEEYETSGFLEGLPKQHPYKTPQGYFDGLEQRLMQFIREHADYQDVRSELESLSPLLGNLKKETPYSVPQGYFETLDIDKNKEIETAKVVSINRSKTRWLKYAAAAVVTGIIVLGSFLFISRDKIDPVGEPQKWVAKQVKKIPENKLEEFIEITDGTGAGDVVLNGAQSPEIKQLLKDLSDEELDEFIEETSVIADDDETLFLN